VTQPLPPDSAPGSGGTASAPPASIGRELAKGAAWMVLMRFAVRALGLVSTFVLARLLVPGDFGLVALAVSALYAVEILGHFNFDVMLIQDRKSGRARYDTAWTLNLIRAVVTAAVIAGLAELAAAFFAEPRLTAVIYVLAAVTAAEGLQNIGIVDFRKELNFQRDFQFMVLQKLFSFCVTLAVAFAWQSYWALVIGIAAGRIAGLVLSYTMHPYRPRLSLVEWRPLVSFSKWLLFTNVLGFFASKLDVFIIGRMFGAHQLGLYNLALEIGALPSTELSFPIQRAVFPGFAKLAHQPERLRSTFVDGIAVLMLLATPASIGIAVLAEPLILVTMGEKWRDAVPIVQIMSVFGIVRLFGANAGAILLAIGKPRVITTRTLVYVITMGPFVVGGILLAGLEGAAWGLTVASLLNVVITLYVTLPVIGVSVFRLLAAIWRVLVATAAMAAGLFALYLSGGGAAASIVQLIVGIPAGAAIFALAQLGLWWVCGRPAGAERIILTAGREVLARWKKPGRQGQ
jgi:lipopolysaccharide exporter